MTMQLKRLGSLAACALLLAGCAGQVATHEEAVEVLKES